PGRRRHAQRQRERFGGERRHGRGAVATKGLVGQERRPTGGLDTGVMGGGVEVGPVGGELELEELAFAELSFVVAGELEHGARVEVADLVLLPDRGAHGTKSSIDHRHSTPQNPLSTRGKSIVPYL